MILSEKIKSLPHEPGVYLMRDMTGEILYIGKANDIKKRVGSYFTKSELPPKIRSLIHFIRRLDYICTATERDALILESRLVKKYLPKYNVLLRDDKSYPYLKLTLNEDFPRLIMTRKKKKDKSLYFGPYPQVSPVRALMRWIQKKYSLRPCTHEITDKIPLPEKKYKSCLYLHIGSCPAPCTGRLRAKTYGKVIHEVKLFLQGSHHRLQQVWEKEMKRLSKKKKFELAAELRDRIAGLKRLYERVDIRHIKEEDLFDRIMSGNALSILKKELDLPSVPVEIEAFDISNLQGTNPVGSMVTFKNGLPNRSGYRMFHIKTVKGANDTAMMSEIILRRYKRVIEDDRSLPGLVLIDGGKPQLSAAGKVFNKLKLTTRIIAALAKKEEELFVPDKKDSIRFPKDSPALLLLRRIRDEAHRFAIRFHTKLRNKQFKA